MENVRFVQLALHQGKTKKSKAAVTLVNTDFLFLLDEMSVTFSPS